MKEQENQMDDEWLNTLRPDERAVYDASVYAQEQRDLLAFAVAVATFKATLARELGGSWVGRAVYRRYRP